MLLGLCALAGIQPQAVRAEERGSGGAPVFVPTSGWLVGPAAMLPEGGRQISLPCVMAMQYNNGYILRFSGGGGKVFAMAADFRQDAFEKGRAYDAVLKTDAGFTQDVSVTALNRGTLLANLQKQDGLYDALKAGRILSLSVNGAGFEFALAGAEDGLGRVEECYSAGRSGQGQAGGGGDVSSLSGGIPPSYNRAMKDQTRSAPPPLPAGMHEVSGGGRPSIDDMKRAKAEQVSGGGDSPAAPDGALEQKMAQIDTMLAGVAQKMAALETAAGGGMAVPAAPAGSALPSYSPPAPAPMQQQSPYAPQIQVQPSPAGQAAFGKGMAAAQPIGRPLANAWMSQSVARNGGLHQGEVMAAAATPQAAATQPSYPYQQQQPPPQAQFPVSPLLQPPPGGAAERRWRAMRGANLHEVLEVWARYENARLIWQADEDVALAGSVSVTGTFEGAVEKLLNQYGNTGRRPVGKIYADPSQSQKVLLVEMKGSPFDGFAGDEDGDN